MPGQRGKKTGGRRAEKGAKKAFRKALPAKAASSGKVPFKLTYATMFDPPEEVHTRFEKALAGVKAGLGEDHPMLIGGRDLYTEAKFEDRSPIHTDWMLGTFQKGGGPEVGAALAAARAAWPEWAGRKWTDRVRLLAEIFRDAGFPDGVFNYVTGGGATVGQSLIESPLVDGITFTGSHEVGMDIFRALANGRWPRPCIAEMGGKNPAIVSRKADLDRAAIGIMRSAFGLQGQKCSACSRILVEKPAAEKLKENLLDLTSEIQIGDPTERANWMGPVIHSTAYENYRRFTEELGQSGKILTGGRRLVEGDLGKGYFCAPTVAEIPKDHRLGRVEMFLPIVTITEVDSLDEAIILANGVDYGLTAGFYGSQSEAQWFFDHIHAGVTYANRPQGATTGSWPGFQPFGGWKGSGSTGKAGGSLYYVPQYLREQSLTLVE